METLEIISVEELTTVMDEVVEKFLIPRFDQLKMNATGEWKETIGGKAEPGVGIIEGMDYTEKLTKGQEPTTVPISDLTKWAKAKFKVNQSKAGAIAHMVQRKIQRVGTSWYEKGGSNLMEVLEEAETLNFINEQIGKVARVRLTDQINRRITESF